MMGAATLAGRAARSGEGMFGIVGGRRLTDSLRRVGIEDWVTFGLMLAMLWSLGWSVWLANWGDLPSLLPTLTLGAVMAFVASRLDVHWSAKLFGAMLAGFVVVMWQGSIYADGSDAAARARDAWDRYFLWIQVAREGGISTDTVPFAMMFMTASWVTAYVVTATTFRTRNPWAPVTLLGFGLMTNLSYRQGLHEQTFYFFILAAIALFAHLTTIRRIDRWRHAGVEYPRSLRWLSVRDGALLAGIVVAIAALLPLWVPRNDSLKSAWELARKPIEALHDPASRLLAGVRGAEETNRLSIPSQNLAFRGPISLTEQPLFWVTSRYQTMYPGRVYHQYTSQGWITGPTSFETIPARSAIMDSREDEERQRLEQVIQPLISTRLILPVSAVYELDRPAEVQYLEPPRYTVPLTGLIGALAGLPDDLREDAFDLRFELLAMASQDGEGSGGLVLATQPAMPVETVERMASEVLPDDVSFTVLPRSEDGLAGSIIVERDTPREQVGVQLEEHLPAEQTYAITTYVVTASDQELAATGADYPSYITDRYLQLPSSLPFEVVALAREIVDNADAKTPFEKVKAIQAFLQDQEYSQEIAGPAPTVDGVYYFLFQTQAEPCASVALECDSSKIKGYSQYFGSAATVLMRAVGVPARMVSGWASGDFDSRAGRFLVRDSHRHGWSQAYFSSYGWIDLEVTPGYPPPERERTFSVLPANIFSAGAVGSAEDDPDFLLDQDQADIARLARQAQEFALEQRMLQEKQQSIPWWIVWTAGSIIGTLALGYSAWWYSLRNMEPGRRTYSKLTRVGWLLGMRRQSNQSPSEYALIFATVSQAASEEASKICQAYVIETYARPGAYSGKRGELEAAWRSCLLSLLSHRVRQMVGRGPELSEARSNA